MRKGGNPAEDRRESDYRIKTAVVPIITNSGFVRYKKRSIFINHTERVIIIAQSAPTNHRMIGYTRNLITKLKKEFGKDFVFYILFHRPSQEWTHKSIYSTFLRRYQTITSITGIIVGIDGLVVSLPKMKKKELTYYI